jgi:hypothetical protein
MFDVFFGVGNRPVLPEFVFSVLTTRCKSLA